MNKYGYSGQLRAKPGKTDELIEILLSTTGQSPAMAGCQLYAVGKDANDEHIIHITEIWDSKEAHDNSLKDEAIRASISRAMPLLDGMPEKGMETIIVGGIGVK